MSGSMAKTIRVKNLESMPSSNRWCLLVAAVVGFLASCVGGSAHFGALLPRPTSFQTDMASSLKWGGLRLRGGMGKSSQDDLDELDAELEIDDALAGLKIYNRAANSSAAGNVNIVFIGHVDSGKSTISGHILYETGGLDDRTLEKFEREAKAIGRESWKYAWAMDTTDEERAKGKTQECGRATFRTQLRHYTILDAPGHKNFVPFMIGGASQAEIGVLVVSSRAGEFEAGFERGGQTREHAVLAKTAGVGSLIVAVNKMDEHNWSKDRWDYILENIQPFLKQSGFNLKTQVTFIPLEGLSGLNLKDRLPPGKCDWYDGPSLLELLDKTKIVLPDSQADLRISVSDKYREADLFVTGKIFQGNITKGQKILCQPSNEQPTIMEILIDDQAQDFAVAGDNVLLKIRGVEDEIVFPGSVICAVEGRPCPVVLTFEAKLNVLAAKSIMTAGYECMLHVHNSVVYCTIEQVISVIDRNTGEQKVPFIRVGQQARVRLSVSEKICVETYKDLQALGRFIMREDQMTTAIGVITSLGTKEDEAAREERGGLAGQDKAHGAAEESAEGADGEGGESGDT